MTKHTPFTAFDCDFDLSDLNDCHTLVDTLEEIGKIRTWQLYDLIATTEHVTGSAEDYQQFLQDIAQQYGQVINVERELCTDDAAAKTILSTYSRGIDQYFCSNGTQPFVVSASKITSTMIEEVERMVFECFGTASEENHVPVQQVEILPELPFLVTRVLEPVRDSKTGLTRIGNIGNFSVQVYTVNIKGRITANFGLQHPDPDAVITDDIQSIAQNLFDGFMSGREAA